MLIPLFLIPVVLAVGDVWTPDVFHPYDIARQACTKAIGDAAAVCDTSGGHHSIDYECMCNHMPGFGSFVDCFIKGYDNNTEILEGFRAACGVQTGVLVDQESFWENYTHAMHFQKPAPSMEDTSSDSGHSMSTELISVDYPIELNYTEFALYKEYYQKRRNNNNVSIYYGYGMLGYWAVVILLTAIVNWTAIIFPGVTKKFTGTCSTLYRKYIGLCATYGRNKAKSIDNGFYLMPSRYESVVIFFFYLLTAVVNGVGIVTVPGNKVVPNLGADLCLKVGVRTGITPGCIFPLLILFAGRSNILQYITRWNYSTFMTYHRWIAINATILVFIHSVTFSAYWVMVGDYWTGMKPAYMIWGTVATIVGCLMLPQSLLVLRRMNYEFFLLFHRILAFFYILGSYYHTELYGYGVFYVVAFGVWALDWLVRLVKMAMFGAPVANIKLVSDLTLKVTIPKPKYWTQTVGGFAYVNFLLPTCFWQAHPFSFTDCESENIEMYIRVKGGVTHGLYKHLLSTPNHEANIRVLVEGPYGVQTHARKFDNTLFLAGGNGVPGIFGECLDLARRVGDSKKLKFVWIVRSYENLAWFKDQLQKFNELNVDATVYITRSITETKESDSENESKLIVQLCQLQEQLPFINFQQMKPSVEVLVAKEIKETDGTLAIVTCGPEGMVDDVRHTVVNNLDQTKQRIDFFEQLQVWA